MKRMIYATVAMLAMLGVACSDYRETTDHETAHANRTYQGMDQKSLEQSARTTIDRFKSSMPATNRFFEKAYAYAVFPEVTKGAAGIGASRGHGVVWENGRIIGYATLTQGSIGAQLGGETFSEVIFFQNRDRLNDLLHGKTELSANASAVAASEGAARAVDYKEGVAVYTMTVTGLMFDASIGGQKFSFESRSGERWENGEMH